MTQVSPFKKGQSVHVELTGGGFTTRETKRVLSVDDTAVYLSNGPGNDPSGPFDPITGRRSEALVGGFTQRIVPKPPRSARAEK